MSDSKAKFSHKAGLWRVSSDQFIKISEMDTEHIQKSIFYSDNRIKKIQAQLNNLKSSFNIFTQKRKELIGELENRGITPETRLLESDLISTVD